MGHIFHFIPYSATHICILYTKKVNNQLKTLCLSHRSPPPPPPPPPTQLFRISGSTPGRRELGARVSSPLLPLQPAHLSSSLVWLFPLLCLVLAPVCECLPPLLMSWKPRPLTSDQWHLIRTIKICISTIAQPTWPIQSLMSKCFLARKKLYTCCKITESYKLIN